MFKLTKRVWENKSLMLNTKVQVYRACVLSTLLYGSESWTTYAHQEHRLNTFHLRCLGCILSIRWQDRIPNTSVLNLANIPSLYSLLSHSCLRWLGHVRRIQEGRIPKDVLYGELASGTRATGRPVLRFKDVCKRDVKNRDINPNDWEKTAGDRHSWQQAVKTGLSRGEEKIHTAWQTKSERRKEKAIVGAEQAWHWLKKRLKDVEVVRPADDWCRECQDWPQWRRPVRIGLMEQRHSAQLGKKRQQSDQYANSMDCTGSVIRHQRTQRGEKTFKCTVCEKAFAWSSFLQKHRRTHTGEKPFRCSVCGKAYSDSSVLNRHQRTHTGEKPFRCSVCGKAYSDSSAFKKHERTHTREKPFKCTVCEKAFTESSDLQRHQRTHTGEKPFKCTVCAKAFSESSHLKIHHRTHTGEKAFKCTVCEKAFSESSALKIHQRKHTGEKPFRCLLCNKAFAKSSVLKEHQTIHTGEKAFKCSLCEKAFSLSSNLKKHQRTHTGDKPFKCSVCEKAFAQSPYLQKHQRTHTGEKPFRCNLCGKPFAESSHLKEHQRTHTGEKPFKCTLCGKACSQLAHLHRHQRTHRHQKIPKECSLKSTCESQSAAMSPSLLKKEPEVNSSLDTMKCIKVKFEEAKVKCEEVIVKSEDVKVKCKDEDSTPKSDLHNHGGNVKQEENLNCEAERGNAQQFVEVEVWVDFLDNTNSNEDTVDV
uniref:Zinc finger protein 2 homolog isoform X1 n=2 Tax=Petromyzon marinus TaxID=7757 RepID=A0AAJ7UF04_PETMA|nr:zinc finger protein 2 homolog isoform X1 [Petromyzon marinus]